MSPPIIAMIKLLASIAYQIPPGPKSVSSLMMRINGILISHNLVTPNKKVNVVLPVPLKTPIYAWKIAINGNPKKR